MDWKSGSGVSVFSVHPGVVNTELTRHLSINRCIDSILYFIGDFVLKTPEMGAQTSIYCATEESLEELSGCYFRYGLG